MTDVTNASRTMLMDLATLDWSQEMLDLTGVPRDLLPEIRPSIGDFGTVASRHLLGGVPITGVLGDQQSAAFGQCAFTPGATKNTYGTGCFLLTNTGTTIERASGGLISTVAFQQERIPRAVRAGGIDRRRRLPRPVAARQPRDHPRLRGGRGARGLRGGLR